MIFNPIVFSSEPHRKSKFFAVKETPVKYNDPIDEGVLCYYPNRKIIINLDKGDGISIVRDNFLAVPHHDAFQLGVELFEYLFGVTPQVHKEYLSESSTDYVVDLVSDSCKFVLDASGYHYKDMRKRNNDLIIDYRADFRVFDAPVSLEGSPWITKNFQDVYRPFIRVSNFLREYNSFYIELGFYRDRCTNGMLLGMRSKTVFKQSYFVPSFQVIRSNAFHFFDSHNDRMFGSMERLWKLLTMPVPLDKLHTMSFDIYEEELLKRNTEEREYLQKLSHELAEVYVKEIGQNMNSALNVATDLSKRLETTRGTQNKLQRKAAMWMHKVTAKSFRLDVYLKSLEGLEERIMTAKEMQLIDDED